MVMRGWARTMVVAALALGVASLGCDKKSKRAEAPLEGKIDGHRKLGEVATPRAYKLDLAIDPARDTFEGEVAITVETSAPTRRLVLHAEDLEITAVSLTPAEEAAGWEDNPAAVQYGDHGGIAVALEREIAPARYVLKMSFNGALDEVPTGLYRVEEMGARYAFTQFEPLEARQAFPCFDEPRFKAPFTVTIRAPKELVAAANGPELSAAPDPAREGWVAHTYQQTKPLPTYLVAVAVGPFDVVEAPAEAIPNVPFRILAPKGKGEMAEFALARTPEILAALTDYFGQPYPFAKLDMVAVPNFSAGAMENVGLVTYRENLLLIDEATATPSAKYSMQSVIAHELAHMWFGNLVTPTWWDELWLNESFATWMATRVLDEVAPSLEAGLRQVRGNAWVMSADSLEKTRAIRQPIEHGGDVYNAFDGITYGKGARVLNMIEAWLGADTFRAGIRQFMRDNAHGSVTTPALMAALEAASGQPVYEVMKTFIEQPGVPLLDVTPLCAGGVGQVKVSQARYLPAASRAAREGTWRVPMCVKFSRGGELATQCFELTEVEQVFTLPGQGCADWLHPNADEDGYYHWKLPTEQVLALGGEHLDELSARERLALLGHIDALLDAEVIAPKVYYQTALSLLALEDAHIVTDASGALIGMGRIAARRGLEAQHAEMLRGALRPHLDRLGLDTTPGEAPTRAQLRRRLLMTLGDEGQSVYVMANAKGLVPGFLEDPNGFPAYRARWAIPLAATEGDALFWDALVEVIGEAKKPSARITAVYALGHFRDPEQLKRTLALFLDDRIRSNEFWYLVGPSMGDERLFTEVTWPWFTANYDAIVAKLGEKAAPRLPSVGSGFCTEEGREVVAAFFGEPSRQVPGLERNLSTTLERIDRCVAANAYVEQTVVEMLEAK